MNLLPALPSTSFESVSQELRFYDVSLLLLQFDQE